MVTVAPASRGAVCSMVFAMGSNWAFTLGMVSACTAGMFPLCTAEATVLAACTREERSLSLIWAWLVHETAKIRAGANSVTTVITSSKNLWDRSMEVRPFGRSLQRDGDSLSD